MKVTIDFSRTKPCKRPLEGGGEPVEAHVNCTNPACRGTWNGARGFRVRVKIGEEARAVCNECFSR